MISVEEAWEVARRNNVPLIVDAAAEEDIQKYVKYSDLAIYSGSKAIEGYLLLVLLAVNENISNG